jgi:hypothetical protein
MLFFIDNVVPLYNHCNMAHIIKKMKNGRPYYYIRETARVDGKPRVVTQIYLGTIERILEWPLEARRNRLISPARNLDHSLLLT